MVWLQAIIFVSLGLSLVASLVMLYGASRWRKGTAELRGTLEAGRSPIVPATYDARELESLPAPVQRYFRSVLTDGQPLVASARVTHEGQFNMGESKDKWVPFRSDQLVIAKRPGFDWNARVRMAPGLNVFVHDAYVGGRGSLQAAVVGLMTVADQADTPELAHGELMRFLAEAVWYPTVLLPSQGVRWETKDEHSAWATLTDGATAVSLEFHFDSTGCIEAVYSAGRHRLVNGSPIATPWQGRFWDYAVRDGMRVPLEGEVAWLLPAGPKPYWRGRITDVAYEFVKPVP